MVDLKWRQCLCCDDDKWHEVKNPDKPGPFRARGEDGWYHDFVKGMPPRSSWEKVQIYCIICNKIHSMVQGPVTGKLYSQYCDS